MYQTSQHFQKMKQIFSLYNNLSPSVVNIWEFWFLEDKKCLCFILQNCGAQWYAHNMHAHAWAFSTLQAALDLWISRVNMGMSWLETHQSGCRLVPRPQSMHSTSVPVCSSQVLSRTSRHHIWNDSVATVFSSAGVPVAKEPAGLCFTDWKCPEGMTLIARKAVKSAGGMWQQFIPRLLYSDSTAHKVLTYLLTYLLNYFLKGGHCSQDHRYVQNSQVEQSQYVLHPTAAKTLNPRNKDAVTYSIGWSWKIPTGSFRWHSLRFLFSFREFL